MKQFEIQRLRESEGYSIPMTWESMRKLHHTHSTTDDRLPRFMAPNGSVRDVPRWHPALNFEMASSRPRYRTPDDNTLSILVATDNHLGCHEQDEIRYHDSFRAFEEILQIAQESKVDFVLLGGDLFHHNKPSHATIHRCLALLRKYCLGDREFKFDLVSDQAVNFPHSKCVNYENPNFNIAVPVFSIHGNHDDPTGVGNLSPMDLLEVSNLVNYFGKADNINEITAYPLLFKKGHTRVAIYGIGSVRDERLHRVFQQKKVKFVRPAIDKDAWFNMFVIHQNRTKHSQQYKNNIPEEVLPTFLDVVIWAHEHECRVGLEESSTGDFFVSQPGSSVQTSLCGGEAVPKHVGIMEISGDNCRMTPIRLRSVRPFIMEDITLSDHFDEGDVDTGEVEERDIEGFLKEQVEQLANKVLQETADANGESYGEVSADHKHDGMQDDDGNASSKKVPQHRIPLVRLRVNAGKFPRPNPRRFGQHFVGIVANHADIVTYLNRSAGKTANEKKQPAREFSDMDLGLQQLRQSAAKIPSLVSTNLESGKAPLAALTEKDLMRAVELFVDKEEPNAIENFVESSLSEIRGTLKRGEQSVLGRDQINEAVHKHVDLQRQHHEDEKFAAEAAKRRDMEAKSDDAGDIKEKDGHPREPSPPVAVSSGKQPSSRGNDRSPVGNARAKKSPKSPRERDESDDFSIHDDVESQSLWENEDAPSAKSSSSSAATSQRKRRRPGVLGLKSDSSPSSSSSNRKRRRVVDLDDSNSDNDDEDEDFKVPQSSSRTSRSRARAAPSQTQSRGRKRSNASQSQSQTASQSDVMSVFAARASRSRKPRKTQASNPNDAIDLSRLDEIPSSAIESSLASSVADDDARGVEPSFPQSGFTGVSQISKRRKSGALSSARSLMVDDDEEESSQSVPKSSSREVLRSKKARWGKKRTQR